MVSLSLLQGIFPTQGSNPGIEPRSPALQADSLSAEPPGKPIKHTHTHTHVYTVYRGFLGGSVIRNPSANQDI